jgi:hypothetical protein
MCEQCEDLQNKIDKYRHFLQHPFDPLTLERIKVAIVDLEQRKAEVH